MNGAAFSVRRAEPSEYDDVGALTLRAYAEGGHVTEDSHYAPRLRDAADRAATAELWVAADGTGTILGTVTFCPLGSPYREVATDSEGEFRMLAVDPPARGHGVARALVRHCAQRCRDLGFGSLVISTETSMAAAHRLYASLGFVHDPGLDWSPIPGVNLIVLRTPVPDTGSPSPGALCDNDASQPTTRDPEKGAPR